MARSKGRGNKKNDQRPSTQVVHGGQEPDPLTGAVMQPVYLTSTYRQPGFNEGWPFDYARTINPTRSALERNLAVLEGGLEARCFASGMSAIHAVLQLLESGDHVIVSRNVYGGTYRLFEGLLRQFGLDFTWVDTRDLKAIEGALQPNTKMLYVETPTNPTLELTDLRRAAAISRKHRLRFVVDNTFMSPMLQRPLDLGADIVVHSTTKFLNGHSDSIGGAVISTDKKDAERLSWLQNSIGAILSPMDSFLILRGIKTLSLRMERHEASARKISAWMDADPRIEHVVYPGLKHHPQHRLARRQMKGFGGMISFDLKTQARAKKFLDRLQLCALAESLGGVESLVSHPASMTHGAVPAADRKRIGVTDGLCRISVGVEDVDDLLDDLDRALGSKRRR
ncbi:MAG: PLP-dependent aspartate aminotransferase family protein [Acidobacteriota bacterium]|nr:PLP-dependent aspartate aminotransferase family protein [Acidobacteriota bacterium]